MNIKKKKVSEMPLLEAVTDETIVHVVDNGVNYKIEASKLANDLPAGVVIDPNYVHTDNNYTTADKAKVAGAIQTETDPTVPAWAKEPTKPTYTASEVGAEPIKGPDDNYVTDAEKLALHSATSHTALLDKNAELTNQHLDTTTEKTTPIDADSLGLWDSVTSTFKRLSVANMLTWFRGLQHTFTQLISFNGGVKASEVKLISGGSYVKENGGTIYHITRWFTPASALTIAANGLSATITSGQFTAAMTGAKLKLTGGVNEPIITFVNSNNITLSFAVDASFFGQSVAVADWGVYSVSYSVISGNSIWYNTTGGVIFQTIGVNTVYSLNSLAFSSIKDAGDQIQMASGNLNLYNNGKLLWSGNTGYAGGKDLGLRRISEGLMELYNGVTNGALRDLKLRSVQVTDNTAAASIDKVGMTRYRPAANGSYYEICMQTGADTFVWHTLAQYTW